jgi:NAD(P)-dependent dehydrogenase (short-subunit alcohol dehydrogenase family)
MNRLTNKVAIITGASRNIGLATAQLFINEGATVISTDLSMKSVNNITVLKLDVTSQEDWKNVVNKVISDFGKIDILINNAGVNSGVNLLGETIEDWNKIILTNSASMMFGMREVIPFMQKQGGGSIVNCSSIVGLVSGSVPGIAYSASKGAIRSMSRQIAQQFAKDRIRVNSIYPGTITNGIMLANKNNMPLPPHVGEPMDVAYGYLYLASDESKFVTGTELVIDGGWFAK